MATVTGLTAERMQEIIDATVVGAHITGNDLILELFDSSEINAGNVRGPIGPQGPSGDPGDVKTSIAPSITGWLIFGASYPNADSAYPTLWGLVPNSWKSGTTLILPSMSDTIVEGGGTLGAITGSNTQTLVSANLPPHQHAIDHDHPSVMTDAEPNHTHPITTRTGSTAGAAALMQGSTSGNSGELNTSPEGQHDHAVNLPNFVGSSGNGPGTSTPVSVEQKALRLNYFIKT